MNQSARYFFTAVLFWIVVDFTTAFNPNVQDWIRHMPLICAFYVGYPALFTTLIYRRGWTGRKLFTAMLCGTVVMELVLFHNVLLVTFPIMLIMIPLALAIYSFITYGPKWIAEGTLAAHRKQMILLTLIWLMVAVLSFKTRAGAG